MNREDRQINQFECRVDEWVTLRPHEDERSFRINSLHSKLIGWSLVAGGYERDQERMVCIVVVQPELYIGKYSSQACPNPNNLCAYTLFF
jgi:hypothetical protein